MRTSTIFETRDVISTGALKKKYEQEFGNPDAALQPLSAGNAVDHDGDDLEGPRAFTRALRTL